MELYAGTEAQAVTVITGVEWLAHTDPLTRCWNRRRFASELDRHLSLSARYGQMPGAEFETGGR